MSIPAGEHHRYWLEVPSNITAEGLWAIGAMVTSQGGVMYPAEDHRSGDVRLPLADIPERREAEIIDDHDLAAVSERLWATPVYATVAHRIIEGYAYFIDQAYPHDYLWHPLSWTTHHTREKQSAEALTGWIAALWDRACVPYRPHIASAEGEHILTIGASGLEKARLAKWAAHVKLNDHQLHGSFGKALDVLRVAAGTVPENEVSASDREFGGDYMPYTDFFERVKRANVSRVHKTALFGKLQDEIRRMVQISTPTADEIVFEGALTSVQRRGSTELYLQPHSIAVASIGNLAGLYRDSGAAAQCLRTIFPEA